METLKKHFNLFLLLFALMLSSINILIYHNGYMFVPKSSIVLFVLFAITYSLTVILSLKFKHNSSTASRVSGLFMPLIGFVLFVSQYFSLHFDKATYHIIHLIITLVASFTIFFNNFKRKLFLNLAIIIVSISGFLIAPYLAFVLIFGTIGSNMVISTKDSPDGIYTAWVVSHDEGALGGDTCVYVKNKSQDIHLLTGTFESEKATIANGEWGESYTLTWQDSEILIVDNTYYNIPFILNNHTENGIYIPDRKADFSEDTHGGFIGDGNSIYEYKLSEDETMLLDINIKNSNLWKIIDEDSYKYLYGGKDGYYSSGFAQDKIPKSNNGYYCFYDTQTNKYSFPHPNAPSANYTLYIYLPENNTLYKYRNDT